MAISKEGREYAELTNLSYKMAETPSLRAHTHYYHDHVDHAKKDFSSRNPNYRIDDRLSDGNSVVAVRGDNVIMAIRGTQAKYIPNTKIPYTMRTGDAVANAYVVMDKKEHGKKFQDDMNKFERILDKYPKKNHILTGHSLGGASAWLVGKRYKKEAHLFSMFDAGTSSDYEYDPQGNNTFYVGAYKGVPDTISVNSLRYKGKKVIVPTSNWESHGLDNFIIEKRRKRGRVSKFYAPLPSNLKRGRTWRRCHIDKRGRRICKVG